MGNVWRRESLMEACGSSPRHASAVDSSASASRAQLFRSIKDDLKFGGGKRALSFP